MSDLAERIVGNRRIGLGLLIISLCIGGALRAWVSYHDDGLYWPDEIYESLEPAHRLVFGPGLIAWEFVEGARNWTLPAFIAALLKISSVLGLDDPRQYLLLVRLALSALGVGAAYGSYLLARRLGVSVFFAACGALFYSLVAPAIYFAPKAFAETASALPVVMGVALALQSEAVRRDRIAGFSLLGVATLLRLQNALFCVAMVGVLALRRRWNQAGEALAVLGIWALILGAVDKLTWGHWFRSVDVYVRVNLGGFGPITGPSPASYYADMLFASMPWVAIVAAALCLAGSRRAIALTFTIALFVGVHVLVANKAYRYILPAFPLIGALSAVGLQTLWTRSRRAAALAAAAWTLAIASSAFTFQGLTFGDIGPYETTMPHVSAYDAGGPVNRLLMAASRRPDLCGLRIETDDLSWVGGYSYFHRPVPLYSKQGPTRVTRQYNYVIVAAGQEAGTIVAVDGDRILGRLANLSCSADPEYDPRLPGWRLMHEWLGS